MDIDMSEIHEIFFDESFEGLDVMESGLLNLDMGSADTEVINNIFRAAHSIKGGGGTFGFIEVSEFTHGVETILDEMRSETRQVVQQDVDLLLESVDCIRSMLMASQNDEPYNQDRIDELDKRIEATLSGEENEAEKPEKNEKADDVAAASNNADAIWQVNFVPHHDMLKTGNDPIRIFHELEKLGELTVKNNADNLPEFNQLNPENCYLSWDLTLQGNVEEIQIREVFDWVEQECDLTITEIAQAQASEKSDDASIEDDNAAKAEAPEQTAANEKANEKASEKSIEKPAEKAKPNNKPAAKSKTASNESIRVNIDKIDNLINLVGELVITQSMLSRFGNEFDVEQMEELRKGLTQLMRNTRELQESVMQIRMLPISFSFNRFPRLVHDISQKLGKQVELKLSGENTELDKTVLEKINDPLVHLVRNSLDHGLEDPETRKENGKSETGTIELNAFHEGGNIIIEVADDGAGLNRERILTKAKESGIVSDDDKLTDDQVCNLIFQAGFSTADAVSDLSGRGVGMDVVKRNINDLGGQVHIKSEIGQGSKIVITLPLTLAILDGQLVRVGSQTYIVPLISIVESLQMSSENINAIAGKAELYKLREEYIPVLRLYDLFGIEPDSKDFNQGLLVIVEAENQRMGIFIDDLLEQQQIVIKSLEANYQQIEGLSGATILGDGTVALILDVPGLINQFNKLHKQPSLRAVA